MDPREAIDDEATPLRQYTFAVGDFSRDCAALTWHSVRVIEL
jgi:hypothetical protein